MIRTAVFLSLIATFIVGIPPAGAQAIPEDSITVEITPESPSPKDPIEFTVTYFSNCFFESRWEVERQIVRLVAVEGCACPPGPVPETILTRQIDALPPGAYRFEFALENRDFAGEVCHPVRTLEARPFVVSSTGKVLELFTIPEVPKAGEAVTLVGRFDACSEGLSLLGRHGSVITVQSLPLETPEECPQEYAVELGELPAGEYLIPIIQDFLPGAEGAPLLEVPFLLTVEPDGPGSTQVRQPGEPGVFFGIQELRVIPEFPQWRDPITVEIDTWIDCPGGQRSALVDDELRLILKRRCDCPPAIPVPITLSADFGPLPVGLYKIVLALEEEGESLPGGPPCRDGLTLGTARPLLVSGAGFVHGGGTIPPLPRAGQSIDLELEVLPHTLIFDVDPDDPGPILEVRGTTPPFDPVPGGAQWRRTLGSRPPGPYFTMVVVGNDVDFPLLEAIIPFRVRPVRGFPQPVETP